MLYHMREIAHAGLAPARIAAGFTNRLLRHPDNPWRQSVPARWFSAGFELFDSITRGLPGTSMDEDHARSAVFGYTIMNDLSARDIQFQEMACRLGPAKGKDFATAIGPEPTIEDALSIVLGGLPGDLPAAVVATRIETHVAPGAGRQALEHVVDRAEACSRNVSLVNEDDRRTAGRFIGCRQLPETSVHLLREM